MNRQGLAGVALTLQLLILVGCAQTAAVPDSTPTVERFMAGRQAVVREDHIASLVTYANRAHPSPAAETSTRFWVSGDLLVPLGVLVLVAAAVLVGTSTAPVQTKRAPTVQLLDGLRNYVARRGVD